MEIFEQEDIITYHIRVRELNKKYEAENNIELDNGVAKEEEEEEDIATYKRKKQKFAE